MPIQAIDITSVKKQSSAVKSGSAVGFSDILDASNPAVYQAVAYDKGYQPALITSAAMSGLSGASGAMTAANAPYYLGAPVATATFGTGFNGSYGTAQFGAGYGAGGVAGGAAGLANPSQDYLEKAQLFQAMNDANWEMLVAQVTVNNISRDYQANSNILKTKSDTELNAVRNMRA